MVFIKKSVLLLCLCAVSIFAVQSKFGVKVQGGLSGFNGDNTDNINVGYVAGAGVTGLFGLSDVLLIAPEVLFSYSMATSEYDIPIIGTAKLDNEQMRIDVPVMARLMITPVMYGEVGPQFSYLLKNSVESKGVSLTGTDNLNILSLGNDVSIWDLGLSVGAGAMVSEQVGIGLRYYYGFVPADDEGNLDASRYQFLATVGLYF
jgi:hypothetical protein